MASGQEEPGDRNVALSLETRFNTECGFGLLSGKRDWWGRGLMPGRGLMGVTLR